MPDDRRVCTYLFEDDMGVLTHCNAGGLATARYGTALALFFTLPKKKKAGTLKYLQMKPGPFCKARGSPLSSCSRPAWM